MLCGLSQRSLLFCMGQPTRQQTHCVYKSGVLECVSEARPLPLPYTLSLINSPVVTDWPCYTCMDMPELLAAALKKGSSFDLNPP